MPNDSCVIIKTQNIRELELHYRRLMIKFFWWIYLFYLHWGKCSPALDVWEMRGTCPKLRRLYSRWLNLLRGAEVCTHLYPTGLLITRLLTKLLLHLLRRGFIWYYLLKSAVWYYVNHSYNAGYSAVMESDFLSSRSNQKREVPLTTILPLHTIYNFIIYHLRSFLCY